ncbi:hypothetical protein CCMSSC00406_0008125 [Pleurotus cornucopiae]|uniref:Uncharacterized protein n=1 Tax=Pleurotus cornucopiae TaxID=5321 RepID=A0ACB7IQF4_PLECO|nr:hypothetical protein CCMSSC00406_0008125 [Pleurotus cornucopiae]
MDFLVEITEPYLTTMKSLMDTVQLLHKLPGSPSVLKLREQVQDFVRIVGCLVQTMQTVHRVSPKVAAHKLFSYIDEQIRDYPRSLDKLTAEVNKHWARLSNKLTSGGLRWILLGIFSTDGWIRICHHVEVLIKEKKEWLERVICLLVNPQWRHLLRDEYGETRRRIKDVGLSSDLDKMHLDVHTIWTQEPARFNVTTTEFSLLCDNINICAPPDRSLSMSSHSQLPVVDLDHLSPHDPSSFHLNASVSSVDIDIPSGAPSLAELLGSQALLGNQALSKVVDLSTRSAALFHPTEHEASSDDERHPIVPFTSKPPLPIQRCATSPGILDLFSAERATKELSITVGPDADRFHITGRVHTLTINTHRGDNFTAPISGGIVGGVRNSNHVENFGPWED